MANNAKPLELSRRGFFSLGLVAAGTALPLAGARAATKALDLLTRLDTPTRAVEARRLALMYWPGSGDIRNLGTLTHSAGRCFVDVCGEAVDEERAEAAGGAALIDASTLRTGESSLARTPVSVRIEGPFLPEGQTLNETPALDLYVHTPSGVAFHLWSLAGRPARLHR